MRVKSHQLPMTMRRATDPRMESLPADAEGGWVGVAVTRRGGDESGGTAQDPARQRGKKAAAADFHLNSKASRKGFD